MKNYNNIVYINIDVEVESKSKPIAIVTRGRHPLVFDLQKHSLFKNKEKLYTCNTCMFFMGTASLFSGGHEF